MVTDEQKKKWWGEDRNAARRQKYAENKAYQDTVKKNRRESYRRNVAEATPQLDVPSCIGNLDQVDKGGEEILVTLDGGVYVDGRVYTLAQTCAMLNRAPSIMYRWHQHNMFPAPALKSLEGVSYYADDEVREFVRIMGEHQSMNAHYRTDHADVRKMLFVASFDNNPERARAWVRDRQSESVR